MDAGLMRHRIEIQERTDARNEYGEREQSYQTVLSVRASIDPVSGREFVAGYEQHSEITHKVTIRYREEVKAKMRVKYGDRLFSIEHILDKWERHAEMTLLCKELIE